MEWILPENITEQDILNSKGFVYVITNIKTQKKYIGKKFVYSQRTKVIKGKKKKVISESDWRSYTGSSEDLNNEISENPDLFQKEILSVHRTKTECNYRECELQFKYDVLRAKDEQGNYKFYNKNILHKYFRNNIK